MNSCHEPLWGHARRRRPGMISANRGCAALLASFVILSGTAMAQLRLSGQASAAFVKANNGYSQYSFNSGRETFAWRLDLFGDAVISDNIFFLTNFRMLQDEVPHIDLLALRMTDIASSGVNAEVGEVELPFGNLGERRLPWSNPFFDLPLTHEHLTTLRSSTYTLWPDDARYTLASDGVRLVDGGLYDLGLKVFGSIGIFDYSAALINGMVSATSTYSTTYASGLNSKHGLGKLVRLSATPVTGLTIGGTYATGPFLKESNYYSGGSSYSVGDIVQDIIEGDVDFSLGHVALYGEAFTNVWTFADALGSDLKAFGYSVEGKVTPVPRVSLALRAGGISFGRITTDIVRPDYTIEHYTGGWDRDVFRLEGAAGYRLDRSVLMKLVYEWNRTFDIAEDPVDNVLVLQSVVSF